MHIYCQFNHFVKFFKIFILIFILILV